MSNFIAFKFTRMFFCTFCKERWVVTYDKWTWDAEAEVADAETACANHRMEHAKLEDENDSTRC